MSEDKNMTILNRVRDKIGGLNRTLVTLAFMGCVNALSAKTVVAVITDVDRDKVGLLGNDGRKYQIESMDLVMKTTAVHNKEGGDLVVKFDFDENTSRVIGGTVCHSPVRYTSSIPDAKWDLRNIYDRSREMKGNLERMDIGRILGNVGDAVEQYSSEHFSGGIVRIVCIAANGKKGWAQYHTVDLTSGTLKLEYDKTSGNSNSYSESSYTSQGSSDSYSQPTRSVSLNQLVKASENRNNGSNYTQTSTSNRGYSQTNTSFGYGSSKYDRDR